MAPETDVAAAAALAERIRARTAARDFDPVGQITMRFGAAEFAGPEDDLQALYERADGALYEAKHGGRNRVVQSAGMPAGSSAGERTD